MSCVEWHAVGNGRGKVRTQNNNIMNKQLLTLTLISALVVSSFTGTAAGEKDKNKPSGTASIELPVLTDQDLEEMIADMDLVSSNETLEIAPQTYQVFDDQDNLIMEEIVKFENSPSTEMKDILRSGEFLMEKGDILIYKIF